TACRLRPCGQSITRPRLEEETKEGLRSARLLHDDALLVRGAVLLVPAVRELERRIVIRQVEPRQRCNKLAGAQRKLARHLQVDVVHPRQSKLPFAARRAREADGGRQRTGPAAALA